MDYELRPFWGRRFDFNWKFGLLLILVVCIPRFILVLNASVSGNYGLIGLIMVVSAMVPFIFLSRKGRAQIGIVRPLRYDRLVVAFAAGMAFSVLLYYAGQAIYGNTYGNWFKYIGRSYNIPAAIPERDKAILFAFVALSGVTFSPIGEELFFRGIVHGSFARTLGDTKAAYTDSAAFALTHIAHFGLVYVDKQWKFLEVPALIWVVSMFLVSFLFFAMKRYAVSIAGAVVCHAGFNLTMIYCIFYPL